MKTFIIIAGPNGAGKTTFAREFLPNEAGLPTFINADLITAGLNPFRPESGAFQAGRLMLSLIDQYVQRGESFAFETTLNGRGYARSIPRWQELGYSVTIVHLRLTTPEMAVARVRRRVAEGGHAIPEEVILRRFHAGLNNFENIYRGLADEWAVYDNSGAVSVLLSQGNRK